MRSTAAAASDQAFIDRTGPAFGINPLKRHAKSFAWWGDADPPPRKWIVADLIPSGTVTLISGDGGLGKSLLAMQLMIAGVTGTPWLGRQTERIRSCALFCEDEEDEIQRRLCDIAAGVGIARSDERLKEALFHSRVGAENSLVQYGTVFDNGEKTDFRKTTDLYGELMAWTADTGAKLLILDSLHDFFTGNENDRTQARYFINQLRVIAQNMDGAVVVLAHPSVAGLQTGTGASGSTAWNNAVRSRLYLTRPKWDGDGPEDHDTRVLKTMKANYGRIGGTIDLRWHEGMMIAKQEPTGIVAQIEAANRDKAVLQALRKAVDQGTAVSASNRAGNWIGRVLSHYDECRGMRPKEIDTIAFRLKIAGEIVEQRIGQKPDRKPLISLTPKNWPL